MSAIVNGLQVNTNNVCVCVCVCVRVRVRVRVRGVCVVCVYVSTHECADFENADLFSLCMNTYY